MLRNVSKWTFPVMLLGIASLQTTTPLSLTTLITNDGQNHTKNENQQPETEKLEGPRSKSNISLPQTSDSSFSAKTDDSLQMAPEIATFWRDLDEAAVFGLNEMHELVNVKEPFLYSLGLYLDRKDSASRVAAFSEPQPEVLNLARFGYASIQAKLQFNQKHPESRSRTNPEQVSFQRSPTFAQQCPLRGTPRCPPAANRYRTADGTCNNLEQPWKGASMLPMQRFLLPLYDDDIQSVRRSFRSGKPLPSARVVSLAVHRDKDVEMESVTMMFVQWGQFIDHDLTSTAQSRAFNASIPRCCANGGKGFLPPEFLHPECLPIEVPDNDWFLGRAGMRCIEFVRSAPSTRIDCDFGWREQINQVTSYLDASMVYGSDSTRADSLRLFRNGLLQYGRGRRAANPPDPPGGELCRLGAISTDCFKGGDGRFGEQPGLTSFHTVFLRFHNRLATVLADLNAHWSDEKIYQETRRIVGALVQHITYKEFLPIVLGPQVMELFELSVEKKGFYKGYNPKINVAPANSFSSAAFRFGHSLVQSSFMRSDSKHRLLTNNVTIHEEQDNPENIWSFGSLDRLILGFCNQASQRRDEFISRELTNHLFQQPGQHFGMDLAAINIQRGRDHGIPPYTFWREPCGLSAITSWSDLEPLMHFETIQRLRSIYEQVEDIDLYPGGLSERPIRGGIVGPTLACIIAQQFSNVRKGDRFWYENGDFESSFTPAQLQQIRKVTFAQILCQVLPDIVSLQPFVFLSPDNFRNARLSCDSPELQGMDLRPWEERKRALDKVPTIAKKVDNKVQLEELKTGTDIDDKLDFDDRKGKNKTRIKNKEKNRPNLDNKLDFGGDTKKKPVVSVTPADGKIDFHVEHKQQQQNEKLVQNKVVKIDNRIDLETTTTRKPNMDFLDFDVIFIQGTQRDASTKISSSKKSNIKDNDFEDLFLNRARLKRSRSAKDYEQVGESVDYDQDGGSIEYQDSLPVDYEQNGGHGVQDDDNQEDDGLNEYEEDDGHSEQVDGQSEQVDGHTESDHLPIKQNFDHTDEDFEQSDHHDLELGTGQNENSDNDQDTIDKNGRKRHNPKRKKKPGKRRGTKKPPRNPNPYHDGIPIDFYNPIRVKVTNISTMEYHTTRRPSIPYDFFLHPVNNPKKPNNHQGFQQQLTLPEYQVSINIQYLAQSTPKTEISINGSPLNDNNGYLPLMDINRKNGYSPYSTPKNPPGYYSNDYEYGQRPSGYQDQTYGQSSHDHSFYGHSSHGQSFGQATYGQSTTNRPTFDSYEDRPFSNPKRPYIYKPSESYLSMFDEFHQQYSTQGPLTHRPQTYRPQTQRPQTQRPEYDYYRRKFHPRPLHDNKKNNDQDYDSDETDTPFGHHEDKDQGEKNFIKISSVQGSRYLPTNKDQYIHTAQQRAEMDDLTIPEDVQDAILVDVIPRANRRGDWVVFNELPENATKRVLEFDFKMAAADMNDSVSGEVPKPFEQFWRRQTMTNDTNDSSRHL